MSATEKALLNIVKLKHGKDGKNTLHTQMLKYILHDFLNV